MTNAKLKLNPSKTELLLIGTKHQRKRFLSLSPTSISDHDTSSASSARNIGVTFDSELKFDHHIRQICKSCYNYIRDLRRIRRHLSMDTPKMIENSLFTSRLDYCNYLLFNVDNKYIKQLQRVQNLLARVVCKTSKFCHNTCSPFVAFALFVSFILLLYRHYYLCVIHIFFFLCVLFYSSSMVYLLIGLNLQ